MFAEIVDARLSDVYRVNLRSISILANNALWPHLEKVATALAVGPQCPDIFNHQARIPSVKVDCGNVK